jgi:hypothetical protein
MNNAPAIIRTLIIYAVIVPLAVFIGYMLSNPLDTSTFAYAGIMTVILVFPLLLRWHHPLLIFGWNSGMYIFFLPGRPELWITMTIASLGISMLQRALGGVKHLIGVPQVTWSLIFLISAVLFTGKMTGLGMHAFGDAISGGRRYATLLGAFMGYFALSSRPIPLERANFYVGLFFLPSLIAIIGDLWQVLPGPLHYIYLFFPLYDNMISMGFLQDETRLIGGSVAATAIFFYMQARYGVRGIFLSGKSWRWLLLVIAFGYGMLGGFRSGILLIAMVFLFQFLIEGLHRTKLLPIFTALGILMAVALIPLAPHLPHTAQRALAFLPLNIDAGVRRSAEDSSNWRFDMWKALLPQIPQHLLLGKGYAVNRRDIDWLSGNNTAIYHTFDENQLYALNGNYHSGPLSVILIFGLWGVVGLLWFWWAAVWVLYNNYLHGNPALRTVNTLLLVVFVARIIFFLFIFGDFNSDMQYFAGWLGLSVSLNGGVCRPAPAPARETEKYQAFVGVRAHLQPALRRPQIGS